MATTIALPRLRGVGAVCLGALILSSCAVRPIPDPRNPGFVRDGPVTMRVCIVEGDGAHAAVGDQVEFLTNRLGRLRLRHVPGPNNDDGAWNGGEEIKVDAAVLVESVGAVATQQSGQRAVAAQQRQQSDRRAAAQGARRFVPVGRFVVRVDDDGEHEPFDFLASKTTTPTPEHEFPECIADVGDDEVLIRGVMDDGRHGGHIIARVP